MSNQSVQDDRYLSAVADFGAGLHRLVRSTEASPSRQADLLQDIHLALWRSFENFDGRCSLGTWVFRVAHNTAASYVYREQRHRAKAITIDEMNRIPDTQDVALIAERADALEQLNTWIRKLKPMDRQILTLYLEEFDANTIAEISGLTAGAVATRVSRLKAKLVHDFKAGSL